MASPDHRELEYFLIALATLGASITKSMSEVTDRPEFTGNAPLLVLCYLDLEGPKRPGFLQDVVGLTSGGTSKLLDRMEKAGLVVRRYGTIDTDYRGVEVAITPDGRKLVRAAVGALRGHLDETATIVATLTKLLDSTQSVG